MDRSTVGGMHSFPDWMSIPGMMTTSRSGIISVLPSSINTRGAGRFGVLGSQDLPLILFAAPIQTWLQARPHWVAVSINALQGGGLRVWNVESDPLTASLQGKFFPPGQEVAASLGGCFHIEQTGGFGVTKDPRSEVL